MTDLHFELIDAPGSVRNLEALAKMESSISVSRGIAYMAYNGRLPEFRRPLRNISGIAVLNSAVVHLIVGPHARARSIDDLHARRHRPIGTGNATTSELLPSDYAAGAIQTVRVPVEQIADMLLSGKIGAAFTISGIPGDEAGRAIKGAPGSRGVAGPTMNRLRNANPFFRSAVIPAGTYSGQNEPVHTLWIDVVLVARKGLDDARPDRRADDLPRQEFFRPCPARRNENDQRRGHASRGAGSISRVAHCLKKKGTRCARH